MALNYKLLNIKELLKWSKKGDQDAAFQAAIFYLKEEDYKNAIKQLELAKDRKFKGKPQYLLGMLYFEGKGVRQNYTKALKLFDDAGFFGSVEAIARLADCYEHGIGVEENWSQANNFYRLAASRGHEYAKKWVEHTEYLYGAKTKEEFEAMPIKQLQDRCDVEDPLAFYYLGLRYIEQKQYELAYNTFIKGYKNQYYPLISLTGIGLMYLKGYYVDKDEKKAFDCFKEAAVKETKYAMYYLGLCYEQGLGTTQDINKAIALYEKACEKGEGNSALRLGYLYENGIGLHIDLKKAMEYYAKAEQFYCKVDDKFYEYYKAEDGETFYKLSQKFLKDKNIQFYYDCLYFAALFNQGQACYEMGMLYYEGKYLKQDYKQAVHYFSEANKNDAIPGTYYMGVCYENGLGCKQDLDFANECYTYAAKKGYEPAKERLKVFEEATKSLTEEEYFNLPIDDLKKRILFNDVKAYFYLGDRYYKNKQYDLALKTFEEGHKKGDGGHCLNYIGIYYSDQDVGHVNYTKAFNCFLEAAESGNPKAMTNVALYYIKGFGTTVDYEKAYDWYDKASDEGEPVGYYHLGVFYENGYGVVDVDLKYALLLYQKAAAKGYKPNNKVEILDAKLAANKVDTIAELIGPIKVMNITPKDVDLDILEARYKKGDSYINRYLGKAYFLLKEYEKAYHVYEEGYKKYQDSECANGLGMLYLKGYYVKKDPATAKDYFDIAAEIERNPNALFNQGYCYENGLGVQQNKQASKHFYESAAKHNSKAGIKKCQELGVRVEAPKLAPYLDYSKASKADLERLYEKGDKNTYAYLGKIYFEEKSYAKALEVFTKRFEYKQDAYSAYFIGYMYYHGQGTRVNYERAFEFFMIAANKGYSDAYAYLGVMYDFGYGVNKNYAEAFKCHKKAAEAGDSTAQYNLGVHYKDGSGTTTNYNEAFKWFKKAAEQGNTEAEFGVGYCYKNGYGVTQDYDEAYLWFLKAANKGDADAIAEIGDLYYYGHGVYQDYNEAFAYYKQAAEAGNAYGQYCLGYLYEHGEGTYEDEETAVYWYQKAARQGHQSAIDRLYELGYSW